MSAVSVLPSAGRRSPEERTVQPSQCKSEQDDDDVESVAPSSPCSVYADDELSAAGQSSISEPYLCSASPLASFPQLSTAAVSELRITDNSHSQSNPSQRKKGGCKSVQLLVHLAVSGASYVVAGKCDVRKSFSNRSFSKYYNRGPYAVIPVTPAGDVMLVVEEAKRGRDGKHFVAMERTCSPPWAVDDKRRHPLLAFAADAVYKVSVLTRPDAGEAEVEVKCQFAQGSATVSKRKVNVLPVASRKRVREVREAELEDDDDEDDETPAEDAGKRRRLATASLLSRRDSAHSTDCTSILSSPASPFSTTDSHVSSPSYPSSPFTASTASPSPPSSPAPFTFHLEPPTADYLSMADELELKPPSTAGLATSLSVTASFLPSPLLAPMPMWPTYRLSSPGGLAFSPWRGGTWIGEVEEFVL